MKKLLMMIGAAAVAAGAMPPMAARADETISADTQLSADMTVSGTLYIGNCATVDLNGHNLTVDGIARADTEDVAGYKFLEYVESDGSQWMNTGYTAAWDDRVETKVLFTSISSGWQAIFCARDTSSKNTYSMFARSGNFRVDHNASSIQQRNATVEEDTEYEIVFNGATGDVAVNNWSTTTHHSEFTPGSPFSLLAAHSAGTALSPESQMSFHASCRLYYFRVIDKNGVTQLDLVPAVRTSDGAIGMYDRKSGAFVENLGSKDLAAGPRAAVVITNSASDVSELRVNVATGVVAMNEAVAINGNVKFIKDGGGTFFQKKTGHTYGAGTQVADGKLTFDGNGAKGLLGGAGFTELDYIQSNGKQWLYSAYTPEHTDKIVMKVNFTSMPSTKSWIGLFCSRGASSAYPYMVVINSGKLRVDHSNSGAASPGTGTFTADTDYTFSFNGATREWSVNDASGTWTDGNTDNWSATGPFSILGYHFEGAGLANKKGQAISGMPSCKLYGFQVYGANGSLKCDMIPAKRSCDGAIGMYDRARSMFIENYGTEAFTAGTAQGLVYADVEVEDGATLELASGARDFCDYPIVLNGGRLKNSSGAGSSAALVASLRLTADSVWENTAYGGMLGRDGAATTIDLGSRTLTVVSENSRYLIFKNTTVFNGGSIIFPEHLWLQTEGEGVDASDADFDMSALLNLNAPLSVRNYTIRRTQTKGNALNPSNLSVHGSLVLAGEAEKISCTMMDGSAIDFSQATAGLVAATSGGIQFEDNAAVTIALGSANIANPVIGWAEAPENLDTLTFVRGDGTPALKVRPNGLYLNRGFIITFY